MPGDPKECRRHAARCAELAVAARTPQLKAAFLGLSKNWETLAIQLEDTFGILEELELVGSNVRQSQDETKRLLLSQKSRMPSLHNFRQVGAPSPALVV
jgi:hypothetical protein